MPRPEDAEKAGPEVTIRFVPHGAARPAPPAVPDAPISVPARLGRGGLSTLCNHLLADGGGLGMDDDENNDKGWVLINLFFFFFFFFSFGGHACYISFLKLNGIKILLGVL
jgi:hypothetical protein